MNSLIGKVKPVRIALTGSRLSLEQKCRNTMLRRIDAQIRKFKTGGKGPGRSWFRRTGEESYFVPTFANVSIAEAMTNGKANAFPIVKTPLKCLTWLRQDVMKGNLDNLLVEISEDRSKRLTERRRKSQRVKPRRARRQRVTPRKKRVAKAKATKRAKASTPEATTPIPADTAKATT
jgi:hypothetical protein